MQHAFVITEIKSYVPMQKGADFRLCTRDYLRRHLEVLGSVDQQVNIQAICNQVLPILILCDDIDVQYDGAIMVPSSALLSVIPIEASKLNEVVNAGQVETILKNLAF